MPDSNFEAPAKSRPRSVRKDSINRVPVADRLVWARLARPIVPLVYLDLNHFINLSKANITSTISPPGYSELLAAASAAVRENRAIFPLSDVHIFEMAAIKDPRQREGIADVMEKLSQFSYLLGRPEIARLEVEAGIEDVLGETPEVVPLPIIRNTFGWAFGKIGGLKIVDADGSDASDSARREMGDDHYNAFMRFANYSIERAMLAGPSDEEIPTLRENGYAPEKLRDGQNSRLEYELQLSKRLIEAPGWRRGRLRDVVSGREVAHEWLNIINEVNKNRVRAGKLPFNVDTSKWRRFCAAMPHTQVAISIKTRYHRDPNHRWSMNDIADIDAISVAYAYCDAVFTDKAARAALAQSTELRRFRTFLPRTAKELATWINKLPQRAIPDLLVPYPVE